MVTIKEIAKKANVSPATVSNILNKKGGASKKTADTVMAIADELNYTPNLYAKNLVLRSSRTLGVITEDLTVFNTPKIVDSIDETCEKNNYHYILGNLRINKRFGHDFSYSAAYHKLVGDMISDMLSKQVEGIIYVGCNNNAIPYLPTKSGVPIVCAYCYSNEAYISSVIYDDTKAAYNIVNMLIEQGHSRIGMICGVPESEAAINRTRGYKSALSDNAVVYNPDIIVSGGWLWETGYTACPDILKHNVTAIFSQNDIIATGVLDYCAENGIAVGSDLSLIGFDNRLESVICKPKLSTVDLPLYQIGQKAASLMIETLAGRTPPGQRIMLNCPIIERDSTFALL